MSEFTFNFPCTKFVPPVGLTRRGQADQIVSEAAEVFKEAQENISEEKYIEELLDCIHACETGLREFESSVIKKVRLKVVEKNAARNYYSFSENEEVPLPYSIINSLLPEIRIVLCFTREEVTSYLLGFGLEAHNIPHPSNSAAEVITAESPDAKFIAVVLVKDIDEKDRETTLGLLVHEATHVATNYLESLGVETVDDEIRAYVTGAIGQALTEEYLMYRERENA